MIIKKKKAVTTWVDEEWMTEKEMKELGWSPTLSLQAVMQPLLNKNCDRVGAVFEFCYLLL